MTTPVLPEFILKLFQNEINKIVKGEIVKVCKIYELDYEEVKTKLKHVELDMTDTPGFRLFKKHETFAPKHERCQARLLHSLEIKQCSRSCKHGDDKLCKKHLQMKENKKLKYGLITDDLPDELRPEVLNEKQIRNIY